MKKLAIVCLLSLLSLPAMAKTYATLNGKAITEKDFEMYNVKQADFEKLPKEQREAFLNTIINDKLVIESARAEGIERSKDYTKALEAFKMQMLFQMWQQNLAKKAKMPSISDSQMREIYNNNKDQFIDQTGRARHILVNNELEAKNIIAELNKVRGKAEAKFIDLANQKTLDPAAKQQKNGGDLGEFHRSAMDPAFSKAAFDLRPGTYTKEPVRTQFGYHIIYLESKSEARTIPYEQAKQLILQNAQMQAVGKVINDKVMELRSKAQITIN